MHGLHKEVAREIEGLIESNNQLALLCDPACGGTHNLPFFLLPNVKKSNKTEITNVDLMIVKNNEIVLVCEIEESDISPIRIFGKLYAFLHSKICILKDNTTYSISNNCIFLQIVSTKKLKPKSSKMDQWSNIKSSIKDNMCSCSNRIINFNLLYGSVNEFIKGTNNHTGIDTLISKL